MFAFGPDIVRDVEAASKLEWLVTNGIGGYAAGTVSGVLSRSYHGLLVAALKPPLGRTLTVVKLDETAIVNGASHDLYVNQWGPEVDSITPRGQRYLSQFALEGMTPVWTYVVDGITLEKRIWMEPGQNTTYVEYRHTSGVDALTLSMKVMANFRDHHGGGSEGMWQIDPVENGLQFIAFKPAPPFYVLCADAKINPRHVWYNNYYKVIEEFRGEDVRDNHLYAGHLDVMLEPGESVTVVATLDLDANLDGTKAYRWRQTYEQTLLSVSDELRDEPPEIKQLLLAADQFIVKRATEELPDGRSVIAGYPWFGDWGRDTMIALRGLTLATGRSEIAERILRTYARFVDRGMIPNRFPDAGETPDYNTVDATLWFFEAIRAYYEVTENFTLVEDLYPVLEDIIEWHFKGTRYRIRVDPHDGLLHAGEEGVQLTWMDVKINDWVVTPRTGKAVDVNALWHNALHIMAQFARMLGKSDEMYTRAAAQVKENFDKFWYDGYCYDVIGGPNGKDTSLRPNQLIAVSLPHQLLTTDQQRSVVQVCEHRLLTPRGLRSLDQDHESYHGRYGGNLATRDTAYHQGTVWSWLIGPFVEAHLRVYGDKAKARSFLLPVLENLREGVAGNINEVFDGNPPHHPRGAFAQAWSVAEILRAWALTRE